MLKENPQICLQSAPWSPPTRLYTRKSHFKRNRRQLSRYSVSNIVSRHSKPLMHKFLHGCQRGCIPAFPLLLIFPDWLQVRGWRHFNQIFHRHSSCCLERYVRCYDLSRCFIFWDELCKNIVGKEKLRLYVSPEGASEIWMRSLRTTESESFRNGLLQLKGIVLFCFYIKKYTCSNSRVYNCM